MAHRFNATLAFDPEAQTLRSQGQEGSCSAQAFTNALEFGYYHWRGWKLDIHAQEVYRYGMSKGIYDGFFPSVRNTINAYIAEYGGLPCTIRDTGQFALVRWGGMQPINEKVNNTNEKRFEWITKRLGDGIACVGAFPINEDTLVNCREGGSGILQFTHKPIKSAHTTVFSHIHPHLPLAGKGNSWGEEWGAFKNGTLYIAKDDLHHLYSSREGNSPISRIYIDKNETLESITSQERIAKYQRNTSPFMK